MFSLKSLTLFLLAGAQRTGFCILAAPEPPQIPVQAVSSLNGHTFNKSDSLAH